MRHALLSAAAALGFSALGVLAAPQPAYTVECANGVYRAGCAGPNGAAVVRKPESPSTVYHPPAAYKPPATVTCARGVYRAGCAGPNGAAVIRR